MLFALLLCSVPSTAQPIGWSHKYDTTNSGLRDHGVEQLAVDNTGAIWMIENPWLGGSKYVYSVLRFDGTTWDRFVPNVEDTFEAPVSDILVDRTGTVWVTAGGDLFRFVNDSFVEVLSSNTPCYHLGTMETGPDGALWIGTGENCLIRYDSMSIAVYDSTNSPINFQFGVGPLFVDPDNTVWLTGGSGLLSFDGHAWKYWTDSNSNIPSYTVNGVAIGPDNETWIAFGYLWQGPPWGSANGGLATFDGQHFTPINPFGGPYTWPPIDAIIQAPDGSLLVGTVCEGIWSFDGNSWTQLTVPSCNDCQLAACTAFGGLVMDNQNRLWYSTGDGLWVSEPMLVGLREPLAFEVSLTPNPTTGALVIDCSSMATGTYDLTITNPMGVVLEHKTTAGTAIHLDLTGQPSGIYIIHVSDGKHTWHGKLMKQ